MVNHAKVECSIFTWYPVFAKDSLDTVILPIPEDVLKYLESDPFILPAEVTVKSISHSKWADGSSVDDTHDDTEIQPTFPDFSKKIQDVIDNFGAVFIKSNWKTPSDAIWVAATKTLKCTTLEEIYLLLKSSDIITRDITVAKELSNDSKTITTCLVLKRWRDINPCTEFRCFVINKVLIGICQRDASLYYSYIESEKYSIQTDIKSLFRERIKNRFNLDNYTFDVIRYKKDKVKIVDFGLLDESATKGTLFTYSELHNSITEPPEFRFIAEDIGIQPNTRSHFVVPREIDEFFSSNNPDSMIDMIRRAIENQQIE